MLRPSLICLVLLSTLIPLIAQAPANLPSRLQAIMRDFDAQGFSGVVLVERQGTVEFLEAYGYADRRQKIRNTPDTRFEMASLTKPFTAADHGLRFHRVLGFEPVAPGSPPERVGDIFRALEWILAVRPEIRSVAMPVVAAR